MLWEILKASKGILVADFYADLWANIAGGGTPVEVFVEMIGSLPLYYDGKGFDLADYLISGNTLQDGTPSADAPVDATGCGVRTGNLWDINELHESYNFITIEDATVFIPNSKGIPELYFTGVNVSIPAPFTISFNGVQIDNPATNAKVRLVFDDDTVAEMSVTDSSGVAIESNSKTFTKNLKAIRFNWSTLNGGISFKDFMLNLGSTALSYEPYGYKLPMTVNGTEYPIYLGQVETTRRIKKVVFNGTEPWVLSSTIAYIDNTDTKKLSPLICTHFPNVTNTGMWNGNNWVFQVNISGLGMSGIEAWITWLAAQYAAGHPVTVWYVLAEPETAIVNEPLMKIGDYADTISYAQAGVAIPTVNGSNVLDMASTVKPSAVYVKGKGIKPTGYGQLTDVNGVNILDKDGRPIYVHGQ